jgi:RING finger protein 113A
MFRKPKRKVKAGLRRAEEEDAAAAAVANDSDDEEDEGTSTAARVQEARKRFKPGSSSNNHKKDASGAEAAASSGVLHTFATSNPDQEADTAAGRNADLAASTASHHPTARGDEDVVTGKGADGVFRQGRNKFWAGPLKAANNVRVTARFDYQPDICKDYKETGFCGYGDTCIYLHDRGDTLAGWQLEEKWQEEQRTKREQQEKELNTFLEQASGKGKKGAATVVADDGLPFACHLCRTAFEDPVVTACQHYFCETCILDHVRNESDACPVCQKETHRVFNEATKLITKRRQVLGSREAKQEGSWQAFFDKCSEASS